MPQGVIVDVISDRAGTGVDRNQAAAIVAAAWDERSPVLVERQAPFDVGPAPVPHRVDDHLEVGAHFVGDPRSARGFGDVLAGLREEVVQGGHGAGRAAVPMPGDAGNLRRGGERRIPENRFRV